MNVDSKAASSSSSTTAFPAGPGSGYLEEWSGIAKAFAIATGYFEIGALLALDGNWQGLDKIGGQRWGSCAGGPRAKDSLGPIPRRHR